VAQPEGGLAGIDAGAEELELEDGVQLAELGGDPGLEPEAGLPDASFSNAASLVGRLTSNQSGSIRSTL
jgi:hypothetical protein